MNNKPILHENEEIRDIEGYEGIYAITSYGRVWSYRSNKFLKLGAKRDGYTQAILCVNNRKKAMLVHRLVAQAFLANPDNLPMVNHKDECKTNNHISNLEWCTPEYNANYGTCKERISQKISQPVYCIELNKVFKSQTEAAKELGLQIPNINACCRGNIITAGGYHWQYANDKANDFEPRKPKKDAVCCVELNKTFKSGADAAKELKMSTSSHILECCKGHRKTAGGYHWKYVNEGSAAAC